MVIQQTRNLPHDEVCKIHTARSTGEQSTGNKLPDSAGVVLSKFFVKIPHHNDVIAEN